MRGAAEVVVTTPLGCGFMDESGARSPRLLGLEPEPLVLDTADPVPVAEAGPLGQEAATDPEADPELPFENAGCEGADPTLLADPDELPRRMNGDGASGSSGFHFAGVASGR